MLPTPRINMPQLALLQLWETFSRETIPIMCHVMRKNGWAPAGVSDHSSGDIPIAAFLLMTHDFILSFSLFWPCMTLLARGSVHYGKKKKKTCISCLPVLVYCTVIAVIITIDSGWYCNSKACIHMSCILKKSQIRKKQFYVQMQIVSGKPPDSLFPLCFSYQPVVWNNMFCNWCPPTIPKNHHYRVKVIDYICELSSTTVYRTRSIYCGSKYHHSI